MTDETRTILDGLIFSECPRWYDDRFWFSDILDRKVIAVDPEGNAETIAEIPGQPGGLGFLPDGRLLIVSMTDQLLLRLDPDGLKQVFDKKSLLWDQGTQKFRLYVNVNGST
jgi:sugar lactone lactonase YvrE